MNCQRCEGHGERNCPHCLGTGYDQHAETCANCLGDGHVFCITCGGTGNVD
ncbi:hypothetical protein [Brevibacillus sp. SYSU BS000544]|uniref:hypothetical protein n=1 Tax=Brevibacillus sp. SYSU BS000544 TaxID=3416443 RepID=UPI003CE45430